jgi:hypothetical protein
LNKRIRNLEAELTALRKSHNSQELLLTDLQMELETTKKQKIEAEKQLSVSAAKESAASQVICSPKN